MHLPILSSKYSDLPLCLIACHKVLRHTNNLLERLQPRHQLGLHLSLVFTELGVEVLTVWRRAHGRTEDGFDNEGVVWLQGVAVGGTEGIRELFCAVIDILAESLSGEVEATVCRISRCDHLDSFRHKGDGWMGKERKEKFRRAFRVL
jgi:hypothetical protein